MSILIRVRVSRLLMSREWREAIEQQGAFSIDEGVLSRFGLDGCKEIAYTLIRAAGYAVIEYGEGASIERV